MNPFTNLKGNLNPPCWTLHHLDPSPEAEWQRLHDFLGINMDDAAAMRATVEPLFRRGHELVSGTYDYLLAQPETAAILGWEKGADPLHLAERRRFFTIWLARLLGMDFSPDFARYLFRAGKMHAAHGPRRAHVPPLFVSGSMSLVNATFARFLQEELPGDAVVPAALAGWNKVLTLHQHLMLHGYQAARQLDAGEFPVQVRFYGQLRTIAGRSDMTVRVADGAHMEQLLCKTFNYYPDMRPAIFEVEWADSVRLDSTGTPWFEARPTYRVKPMWRVLHNGQDISFVNGPAAALFPDDEVHLFPPGR